MLMSSADDRLRLGEHLRQVLSPVGLFLSCKMFMHAMLNVVEGRILAMKPLFNKLTGVQLGSEKPGVFPCSNLLISFNFFFLVVVVLFCVLMYLPFSSHEKGVQTKTHIARLATVCCAQQFSLRLSKLLSR